MDYAAGEPALVIMIVVVDGYYIKHSSIELGLCYRLPRTGAVWIRYSGDIGVARHTSPQLNEEKILRREVGH